MRPIKYDALQNDVRLMEMALYEVTKGQTSQSTPDALVKKVAEYKALIKRKTFTIDQLEDKVFSRYGIMNSNSFSDTQLYDASIAQMPKEGLNRDNVASLFGSLFKKAQGIENPFDSAPNALDILKEIEDEFNNSQLDSDFPKNDSDDSNDSDDLDNLNGKTA